MIPPFHYKLKSEEFLFRRNSIVKVSVMIVMYVSKKVLLCSYAHVEPIHLNATIVLWHRSGGKDATQKETGDKERNATPTS